MSPRAEQWGKGALSPLENSRPRGREKKKKVSPERDTEAGSHPDPTHRCVPALFLRKKVEKQGKDGSLSRDYRKRYRPTTKQKKKKKRKKKKKKKQNENYVNF